MKKSISALLLVFALALTLIACGDKDNKNSSDIGEKEASETSDILPIEKSSTPEESETISETTSATESSQAKMTSSKVPLTTSSAQSPITSSAPKSAAFAVYIGGKAVDSGTLEQVNQKVTIENYNTSTKKDLSGDVYADAEKLIAAFGLKTVSGKTKEDILRNFSISDNAMIVEARSYENEYGNFVMFFIINEGADGMAESGLCYEKTGNVSVGGSDSIVSTLKIKKVNGKLFVPVSLLCEIMGYNYELKDTGFYITK